MKPYQTSIADLIKKLSTDSVAGLTAAQVRQRFEHDGPNALPEVKPDSWLLVFLRQFQSPLIYILLVAATIIFFVGPDKLDAFIISGVLFFNAILGTLQEGRTHTILQSLRRMIKTTSMVVRDGRKQLIDDSELVVGDVLLLQEGQRVPADVRIIESNNLRVNESMLTGESTDVNKHADQMHGEMPVADRKNMLFRGTYVVAGSGKAVVVATGLRTQIGAIHTSIQEIDVRMPLREEVDRLSYWVLIFILGMCSFLFVVGMLNGKPLQELLVMLTALFICVVPEGLPVALTMVLVAGVYRMAQHNVLVKNMQAVEALGRTDVIVIDKTGTLTRNEMMVTHVCIDEQVWSVSGQGYHTEGEITRDGRLLEVVPESSAAYYAHACCLLNSAEITHLPQQNLFDIKGDPTEAALFVLSQKMGVVRDELETQYRKLYEIPFDSVLKYHAGFYQHASGQGVVFIVGSPEVIFKRCANVSSGTQQQLAVLLDEGLRVVAVAMKKFDAAQEHDFSALIEHDLTLLGLCALQDAIRPEVRGIVEQAGDAGLRVIMATGDHKTTALYVAKKAAIYQEGNELLEGAAFDQETDEQILPRLENITVFARVTPAHKQRIIKLYHQLGKIVAMTGDGINDAPSLVAADLGIGMGRIGTEVAKQASDMILLDDSFVSVISAIEQGRHIFYTLKRVVLYFFATNFGEILIVLFALIAGLPLPITAAQILWLNLVTDGFLDVALTMEPKEQGLLRKKWLQKKIHLVDAALIGKMLFMALPMGIASLWVFMRYYQQDLVHARTMTLLTLAMFQWFNAWNCRSENKSVFQLGLFSNRWLVLATSFVLLLQVALVHVPFMHILFKTVPISLSEWGLVFALSSSVFFMEEVRKWFVRRSMD